MRILLALALVVLLTTIATSAQAADTGNPKVTMETSKGAMVIELYPKEAPKTVENFLAYIDAGFFDGTIFHRVIPGFVIQGGGFTADMERKDTRKPIVNEADNGLKNLRGTLSMARTSDPDSATSQFFINLQDNASLDHNARSAGYAVFGKVIEGLDVIDAIAAVPTTTHGPYRDVPREPVAITGAKR
ncbi:MAG: peptidyl-prolyl cis-trans isomerase [Deltaproteobacteria bacterium]|nr:peptidyl-prolyl cis-trans isomerase [Candidatus Anaeroferrophillacea bacterium]